MSWNQTIMLIWLAPAFLVLLADLLCASSLKKEALSRADIQFFGDFYVSPKIFAKLDDGLVAGLRPLLNSADLNLVNFEGAATDAFIPDLRKKFTLRMPPALIAKFPSWRIHALTLANNHVMDFGLEGLFQTMDGLEEASIPYAGVGLNLNDASSPMILRSANRSFCIYAFTRTFPKRFWADENKAGTAFVGTSRMQDLVRSCAALGLSTVVSFHWGQEMSKLVAPYQRKLAQAAIDAGALTVIGHHPHVIQPIEWYRNRPIFYSIGNFLFASRPNAKRRPEGMVVRIRFRGGKPLFEIGELEVDHRITNFKPYLKPGSLREIKAPRATPAKDTWT